MQFPRKTFLTGLGSLLATPALITRGQARRSQPTIRSEPPGGTWCATGGGLAGMFTRIGLRANSEVGGAIKNIIQVSRGNAEAGFTFSAARGMARAGKPPFPAGANNLRALIAFEQSWVHVLVSRASRVERIEDLRGKPFASQPPGRLTRVAFADLLYAAGLSDGDLGLSRGSKTDGADGVKDRRFAGVTAPSGIPRRMSIDVAASIPSRLPRYDRRQCRRDARVLVVGGSDRPAPRRGPLLPRGRRSELTSWSRRDRQP